MYGQLILLGLVSQLGSDSFIHREAAQAGLIAASPYSSRAVLSAMEATDPEIRRRVKYVAVRCKMALSDVELYIEAKELIIYFITGYAYAESWPLTDKERRRVIDGGKRFHKELVQVARNYSILQEIEKSPLDDPGYRPDCDGGKKMCDFVDRMRVRVLKIRE